MARSYTATRLGALIGASATEVNSMLEDLGLHRKQAVMTDEGKNRHRWVAEGIGLEHSSIHKGMKGEESYEVVVWDQHVADLIGAHRPPSRVEFDALAAVVAVLQARLGL